MKVKFIFLVLSLLLAACSKNFASKPIAVANQQFPGVAKQEYVLGTEDLPIYHGFESDEDKAVSYDTLDGRILDAVFSSDTVSAEDVRKFYNITLPQLGWHLREYQIYERDGEILKLNIVEKNNKTLLKFYIRPDIS